MTKHEAVEVLKKNFPKRCKMVDGRMRGGFDDTECEHGKALLMAIEALESDKDLISRQAVLATLKEVFREYNMGYRPGEEGRGFACAVPKAIMDIPSSYPAGMEVVSERQCVKHREHLPDKENFERVMKPAIAWLQEKGCPHEKVIIRYDGAELVGEEMGFSVEVPD